MGPPTAPPVTTDFRSLDFERLWVGRDSTTEVERALLGELIARPPADRCLEIGPGSGRLTPVLRSHATEYVALDLHAEFLRGVPWTPGPVHSVRVVADAHYTPFVDGSFSLLVVVRVYNFFPDPIAFLREAYRLLLPGGRLVLGYQPHPSLATLVDDTRLFLGNRRRAGAPTLTFSRRGQIPSASGPFPAWLPRRSFVRSCLHRSGFDVKRTVASGLEDYLLGRCLPPRLFIRIAPFADGARFLPTQFVLARKVGDRSTARLPSWTAMLACPNCATPFGSFVTDVRQDRICPRCRVVTRIPRGVGRGRRRIGLEGDLRRT